MRRILVIPLFLLVFLSPAAAAPPADPFTVTGIQVDASAASATEAQNIAINSGFQRAWTAVIHRLTKQEDWSKLPTLDDQAIQRLVANYLPVNVRRSTTRYSASMTYTFNGDAVRRMLRGQGIAYTDMAAHPILIVPLAPRYDPHGAWTNAFFNPRYSHAAVPLNLPIPDAPTISALGAVTFDSAQWPQLQSIAGRVRAEEGMLLLFSNDKGKVTVKLRHVGIGAPWTVPDVVVPEPPGALPAKIYADAADAAAAAVINAWKAHSAIDFGKRSRLVAAVQIESLDAWGTMQQKLATVPTITDVGVVAMDIGEARVSITYVGTAEQLKDSIAQAGYDLENDGGWSLEALPPPANASTP
ncbi:MAG TPA: DUF2066 domain-containing protein [Rhizomicrobium sp.]|nr:DUF2066 domain-containing protein [Rhizomicrobium sp.]